MFIAVVFHDEYLNQLMLAEVRRFASLPTLEISERWPGIYAKIPGAMEVIAHPEPGVTVVNALASCGMSRLFGLAEMVIAQTLP